MLADLTQPNRSNQMFDAQYLLDSFPSHVAIVNREGTIIFTNAAWQRFAEDNGDPGLKHTGVGNNFLVVCQKAAGEQADGAEEVLQGVQNVLNGTAEQFAGEYACHSDSQRLWFLLSVSALHATPPNALVAYVDITEYHERLRQLSRKLLTSQEDEQRRIARDLHDDVSQRMALLILKLQQLSKRLPADDPAVRALEDINVNARALLEDLQHVAYELHPSILEDLGLRAAIQCYVDDVARWHNIKITLTANDDFKLLPWEIASCLYRIAQESVRNAVKYAQSSDIAVTLAREKAGISLTVGDSGQGFDVEKVKRAKRGLGLVSMEERARLVNGQVTIASQPGQGTVINVFVPLTLTP